MKAWCGFYADKPAWLYPSTDELAEIEFGTLAVYKRRSDALRHYEDVRRVEIREVKRVKR